MAQLEQAWAHIFMQAAAVAVELEPIQEKTQGLEAMADYMEAVVVVADAWGISTHRSSQARAAMEDKEL
jgi:hypothetical protein